MLSIKQEFDRRRCWGLASSIDLYNCDPKLIKSISVIKKFVIELCKKIEMKRFGNCRVVNFGEDPRVSGFSMTQLIETSLISAHFANQSNAVYLDIFSCKFYEPKVVAEFAKNFFKAKKIKLNYTLRE